MWLWSLQPTSLHANHSVVLFLGWFEHGKFLLLLPSKQGRRKGSPDFATDNRYERYYCLTQGNNSRMPQNIACSKDSVFYCKQCPYQAPTAVCTGLYTWGTCHCSNTPFLHRREPHRFGKSWRGKMVTRQCSILGGHKVLLFPCREFLETSAKKMQRGKGWITAWLLCGSKFAQCIPVDEKKSCMRLFIHFILGLLRSAVIQMTLQLH